MSSATRNSPQVPQTTGDTQYNVRDAALRGASSAFSKPAVKPKPQVNTYAGGNNGALLAATKVGTGTPRTNTPSRTTSPLRKDWTGGSARSVAKSYVSPVQPLSNSSSHSTLAVRDDSLADRVPSPSNIAAKLAAARYSPMKPLVQPTGTPIMSERDANEGDILPAPGSVGDVLARLNSRNAAVSPSPLSRGRRIEAQPVLSGAYAATEDHKPTDDASIAPTTSLVKMFEQNQSASPRPSLMPNAVSQKGPPPVRSPKPQRAFNLPPEPKEEIPLKKHKTPSPAPVKPKPKPQLTILSSTDGVKEGSDFSMLRKDTLGIPPIKQKSAELAAVRTTPPRPKPPPKKGSRQVRPRSEDMGRSTQINRRLSSSLSNRDVPSSPSSFVSAQEEQEEEKKPKPTLPPPRRSTRPKSEASSETRPKTATPLPPKPRTGSKMSSPMPPPQVFPPPRRASISGSSTPTGTLYHSNYQRDSVKAITKHMTGESLSSAIVGAALASSRNVSPARPLTATPPLPTRRQTHHHHSPFHRSPSPTKQQQPTGKLRTTLRKEPSSSSDEEESEKYKRKGTRIMGMGRKHPNKHREGTRKRWRDQITERERKRYEGVWAANKGLHVPAQANSRSPSRQLDDDDPAFDVLNLTTKEIWTRSRLPEHVLEEVWDLVDGRGVGRLRREEFVVGLWLIDQRLKGRKLPIKVSESVWGSVRGAGVKVKVGNHR